MFHTGAILDVKAEVAAEPPLPEPVIMPEAPPVLPPEAIEAVKSESNDIDVPALPSVFDPLPESPKEEKLILPLPPQPHQNDGTYFNLDLE